MGRAWRIEYEGAFYHILSRGNERKDIFLDDKDRRTFLSVIGEMSERFEINVFAFVLMTNHYHLLIRTQHANLSKAIQWLGVTYTRRFNNRHSRSGHLGKPLRANCKNKIVKIQGFGSKIESTEFTIQGLKPRDATY